MKPTIEDTIIIEVEQKSFHGWTRVPIRGSKWQAHNELYLSCHMEAIDANNMLEAARCPAPRHCLCGGLYSAEPYEDRWLVHIGWIDTRIHTALQPIIAQCLAWQAESLRTGRHA